MVHLLAVALSLDAGAASHFARLALKCARQEYPNKLEHVMNGAHEVLSPRALHPAFYGCYDWHSTVHGHWMLARLLRQFPQLHTNPVNVIVAEKPIRAARASAQWCLDVIDLLWKNRERRISEPERDAARAAYDRAIAKYQQIKADCEN